MTTTKPTSCWRKGKKNRMNDYGKITIKIVRSFSLGFTVYSPKLNGIYVELHIACITVGAWSRGSKLIVAKNFWKAGANAKT